MQGSSARERPLVLRREAFGGILFDPCDGTQVEVDGDAYAFLANWLPAPRAARSAEEEAFLAGLRAEVPALDRGPRAFRIVEDFSGALPPYRHTTVLATPALVDVQLTTRCRVGCPHCYASSRPDGEEMSYEDALLVLDAIAEVGVLQLALGGGEPLLHPRLPDILRAARERGLVPNLTTTGDGLTPESMDALARYCGAVALSLEGIYEKFDRRRSSGFAFFEIVHGQLRGRGIPTAFQVTLSAENVPELPEIVDYCLSIPDLYGVIFLAYKPAGRGLGYQTPLSGLSSAELFPVLKDAFLRLAQHTRVGYDYCLTPGIVGMDLAFGHHDANVLEGCSGARKSVGIAPNLDVVPCTFLTDRSLGNLREQSLLEIWRGEPAHAFRLAMDHAVDGSAACRSCTWRDGCLGGCPEWDLVRCHDPG